ncbi:BTAD domain-containing putative transcriptional regulator [Umezawaea sp. Da 62-37]|uniref:AfsR/SARP family transcriptional regulator n=1 Tax=Umezawaea sp. Da 62-37 TaxID=3075927 RepID=UPI0028F70FB8|nr:BTAD domain-containing putative transcriptional regulator [Umezawaea sp. Da 62-37]WNV87123.1 BTAD domain-containing putative transcriptional regulator [Umezawaea sp. Da 62-37]
MQFRVLGPVQLVHGDLEIPIARAKQRHALGVLLLAQGRPVTTETMMAALWGDVRPPLVRKSLQSYISKLRLTLRSAKCTAQLHTRDGTYLLSTPDDDLDYAQSLELLDSGRRAMQRGFLDDAAHRLHRAIEPWLRGSPVQGLNTIWMELRREDLQSRLLSCRHALISVELLRKQYNEALDMTDELIGDNEFDKTLISQRLSALNGCGYYEEFDTYWQRMRNSGLEAFGTEPDTDLRNLHTRLLRERDGYHLFHSPVTVTAMPIPTPAQLPAPSAGFTGRKDELDTLDEALVRTRATRPYALPVLAVVGGAATGKTALAVQWSQINRRHFSDGQLFADLSGFDATAPADPFAVLADFLIALGLSHGQLPDTTERRASRFRSMVDGRQMLVLLDNARNTDQIRPLLPGSSSCVVVVTSRYRLPDLVKRHGARRVTLEPLTRSEGVTLLRQSVESDRVTPESTALPAVVDLCEGLPGLLRVVAEVLDERPHLGLDDLVADLRRSEEHVLLLSGGEEDPITVDTQLSWSYSALASRTARTLRLVSLHFADRFGAGDTAALADVEVNEAQRHLNALWSVHLLQQSGHQRYHFRGLDLAFARRRLRQDHHGTEQQAALRRLLDWYLHTATNATRALLTSTGDAAPKTSAAEPRTFTTAADALLWLRTEHDNLVAAVRQAVTLRTPHVWLLPEALHPYLALTESLAEWGGTYVVAMRSAREAGDDRSELMACLALASVARATSRDDEAGSHLTRALGMARSHGFDEQAALALRELGMLSHLRGDSSLGFRLCHEAWQSDAATGNPAGEAASLHCLGVIRSDRRDYEQARSDLERALDARASLGLRLDLATTCRQLGVLHSERQELDRAMDYCGRVVDIGERHTAHRRDLAAALLVLGEIEHHRGHHFTALTHLHRSLALCHPLNDKAHAARTLDLLGEALHALGKREDAGEEWEQALLLLTDLEDPHARHVQERLADLASQLRAPPREITVSPEQRNDQTT